MKDELIRFIKFNAVGLINTAVDFLVFTLLVALRMHYIPAQIISYACGTLNSYIFNSRWTFQDKRDSAARVFAFVAVNLVALGVSIGIQAVLNNYFGLQEILSKLIALPFSIAVNFVGNRLFVFKKER
ncbi:MAG: GtrA family protein [Christensenellales bacterium]